MRREHGSPAVAGLTARAGSARECFVSCLRQHTRETAAALARPPHECADRLCRSSRQSLRLRCSCLRVWACAPCRVERHRLSWRGEPDSELSVRCTPFRTARRPAPSHRSCATSAAHQTPFAPAYAPFRSTRRNIGDTLKMMLAALARFACRVPGSMATPLDWLRCVRPAGMKHRHRQRCSLRCAPGAMPCLGQSPDTRAVMFTFAQTPAPAAQDPRCSVPAVSRLTHRPIRRPDQVRHNSVLCPLTRCAVTALAAPTSRSSGQEPAPRHLTAASFTPASYCHSAVFRNWAGSPVGVGTQKFSGSFCSATSAVQSHRPSVRAQARGVLGWCPLKTTPSRKPRGAHSGRRAMGTGRQSSKKKP